ncbi:MAG: hypothetical protein LAT65_03180 [Saccharospirillum sp.]|nr:hypothetical protein [Saccharospirillum sp.]
MTRAPINAFLVRRLLVAITLGVLLTMLFTVTMQYTMLTRTIEEVRDRNVDASLSNMLPLISESLWSFDTRNLERAAQALLRDPYISGVYVASSEGEVSLKLGDLTGHDSETLGSVEQLDTAMGSTARLIAMPILRDFNDGSTQIGWITLSSDNRLTQDQVRLVIRSVIVSALLAIALLIVVLYGVVKNVVALPIQRFTRHVNRLNPDQSINDAEPFEPLLADRQDEIGQLYQAFNEQHQSLLARDRALQEHRDQLEHIVSERTKELQHSNEELSQSLEKLKIAQEELLQSEKLASLGNLVSGVAHEVNTPLGVSITAASHLTSETQQAQKSLAENLLKRSDLERFFEECMETSQLLSNNLDRAAQLIRAFKQVAVDQTSDEQRLINLKHYVDEVMASLRPKYKHLPIEIINDIEPDLTLTLTPGALAQVITNLVINSLIHGFEEGKQPGLIRFSTPKIDQEHLQLLYEDDGKGMTEETIRHIFDPFYTTRRSRGGSGLGMNIVFNLITAKLKGKIRILNAPQQGCRLAIQLPYTHTAHAQSELSS